MAKWRTVSCELTVLYALCSRVSFTSSRYFLASDPESSSRSSSNTPPAATAAVCPPACNPGQSAPAARIFHAFKIRAAASSAVVIVTRSNRETHPDIDSLRASSLARFAIAVLMPPDARWSQNVRASSSCRSDSVKPSHRKLLAQYAVCPTTPTKPNTLDIIHNARARRPSSAAA
jgi:hypothetical protein